MARPIFTLVLCIAVLQHGWADDKKTPAAEQKKVTYEDDVKPIFRQHCLNCHNQGEAKGGLALDSYTAMMEGGGSGEIVYDDGDADSSRLWQLVNHDDTPIMPPKQEKMAAAKLAVIRAWIEGGILENSGSKAKAKKKNALAFVASTGGKPDGPAAMPETVPTKVPVVTARASAITAIAASPWAPLIAIAGQKQIVLYHSDTNELLGVLPFAEGIAQSLRFSRDGAFLIAGGGEHSSNGIVAVYNVRTGERVATVGDELDTVFDGDANSNLTRIAMGGPQKMLRIYDAGSGERLFDLKKHTDWIFAVAFSPDGKLIASADRSGGVCVWESETGRLSLDLTGHKGPVYQLSWRDDSKVLASAGQDGTVRLWDIIEGKQAKSISAHGGGVMSVAFDHQGRLATGGKDNRATLWDGDGKRIKNFDPSNEDILEVAITHDGKRVVYGDWNGAVFSALADDPKKRMSLAANPKQEKPIDKARRQLASLQNQLSPIQAAFQNSEKQLVAARKPIDDLNKRIALLRDQAAKAKQLSAKTDAQLKELRGELPQLTRASRNLHDAVIAARVNHKAKPGEDELVAAAEMKLGEALISLAKKRREQKTIEATLSKQRKAAADQAATADRLAKDMPSLKQKLDAANKSVQSQRSKLDEMQTKINAAKSKVDRLATAKGA